jgi:hypothetical protein
MVFDDGTIEITGTAQVGETLTVEGLNYVGTEPVTITYQWIRSDTPVDGWSDIEGATSATYELQAGDEGKYITIKTPLIENAYGEWPEVVGTMPGIVVGPVAAA